MATPTLDGKVVIVTGAARGIGRSMTLGLVSKGARVAMVDRSADNLAATAEEARGLAGRGCVETVCADITREKDSLQALDQTLTAFGRLDALVNNAGVGRHIVRNDFLQKPIVFWELSAEHWQKFMDINATGFFLMTRAALGPLLKSGKGRVVSVTTSMDTMIRGGNVGYGGSKAAVEASMATLAHDLALAGSAVTANVLVPGGPVNTPAMPEGSGIDRSAFIQPEVMVPPLAWLLSDAAEGVSGRRFVATQWDVSLPVEQMSAPTGWPDLGGKRTFPKGMTVL